LPTSSAIRRRPGGCWPTVTPDAPRRRFDTIGRPWADARDRLPALR
jgi:hypothetical protein